MEWADALARKTRDPQIHLIVNANGFLARLLPASASMFVYLSWQLQGEKKPKKRCYHFVSLPRQSNSHSCPWHTWLLAELRLVLLCRHRMKHAQYACFNRNASSILDYYRQCSVSVSSFCRVWVHIKWDQESLVAFVWLSAQANHLFWKVVFSQTSRLSNWNTYFIEDFQ